MLRFSLAMRMHSPHVEMLRQLGHATGGRPEGDHDAWVRIADDIATDTQHIQKNIEAWAEQKQDTLPVFSHDYIYASHNTSAVPVAFLYANPAASPAEFRTFHNALTTLAKAGQVVYVLRYYLAWDLYDQVMNLQGYGVDLAIKNLEYKAMDDQVKEKPQGEDADDDEETVAVEGDDEVQGFKFNVLKERHPALKTSLHSFRQFLSEQNQDFDQLKVWDLKNLGVQASQRILAASDPLRAMRDISQSFPTLASSLTRIKLNQTLVAQITDNQNALSSDTTFLINGRAIDPRSYSIYRLLSILKEEVQRVERLQTMYLPSHEAARIASASLPPVPSIRFNITGRTGAIQFMNDLEKEPQYGRWPRTLMDFARRGYPGQMKFVAKNVFTVVTVLDPSQPGALGIMATVENVIRQNAPLRFGFVFVTDDEDTSSDEVNMGRAIAKTIAYLLKHHTSRAALMLMGVMNYQMQGAEATLTMDTFAQAYEMVASNMDKPLKDLDEVLSSKEFDSVLKAANQFAFERGLSKGSLPLGFLNGKLVDQKKDFMEGVVEAYFEQVPGLQTLIVNHAISDSESVYEFLMAPPKQWEEMVGQIAPKFSPYIIPTEAQPLKYIPLVSHKDELSRLAFFESNRDAVKSVTHIIAVNPEDPEHLEFLHSVLERVEKKEEEHARWAVLINPGPDAEIDHSGIVALLAGTPTAPVAFVRQVLDKASATGACDENGACKGVPITLEEVFTLATAESAKVKQSAYTSEKIQGALASHRRLCRDLFKLQPGEGAVVSNGRLVFRTHGEAAGDVHPMSTLSPSDMTFLGHYQAQRVSVALPLLNEAALLGLDPDDITSATRSNIVMGVASLLGQDEVSSVVRKSLPANAVPSVVLPPTNAEGEAVEPLLDVVLVVDPLSKAAQKLSPLLMALRRVVPVTVTLYINPVLSLSDLPLKNFYHLVLQEELEFTQAGQLTAGPSAMLSGLPPARVLTLAMETPEAWLVQPIIAKYDLDNIKLEDLPASEKIMTAVFRLEHILVEGSCNDITANPTPPRGLELELAPVTPTPDIPTQDTLVMSNLGYYQLKANPGIWRLRIATGRGTRLFTMQNAQVDQIAEGQAEEYRWVAVTSFLGEWLLLNVVRRPGMEKEQLLLSDEESKTAGGGGGDPGLWDSFSNLWGGDTGIPAPPSKARVANETIHIFSVASGHLYERFLKIMMLSVLKNTNNPVKFWFLKNFLSPQFKDFIPVMASEYGFDFELVTYKWPHWLRGQTEKQRLIWGYKILFLDVLFPLNVRRVIFVDADQVVRSDMMELVNMDLQGASLGYTPFCSDKPEMDGFKFWRQGYWKDHLHGKPYHISALYVIDLARFRRQAAGDQLRASYDMLSRDPNSLANLDQDLPNYLQHQVRIFSLPQEWLWCETWCSEESKTRAKTIDLCNNPLTKTPKLENAVRIIPEWTSLDEEAKALERKIATKTETGHDDENAPHQHEHTQTQQDTHTNTNNNAKEDL
eukprot:TRINITY_DN1391_c0_g1_i1.p1 TRINITY_DN1391_c0_g1~~TRINITY_DN1391_c0_g1_i1.p1  ORF type:complete len:1486 (+),score=528.58 TRINITY_DN1391_c0_g1_i1:428-4885(+)